MSELTPEQVETLRARIREWRAKAEPIGPMHAFWDPIFDAEALLADRPTVARGTKQQVFERLMAAPV